jgi:hypothetical protein
LYRVHGKIEVRATAEECRAKGLETAPVNANGGESCKQC